MTTSFLPYCQTVIRSAGEYFAFMPLGITIKLNHMGRLTNQNFSFLYHNNDEYSALQPDLIDEQGCPYSRD